MKRHLSIFVILIVVAAMLAVAPVSASDETFIIFNGGVYDWNDDPVSATVILNYGGVNHTDMTDYEGQFSFSNVPVNTPYTIYAFTDDGFSTRTSEGDTYENMYVEITLDCISIYGRVADADDNPVGNAYVRLYYGGENHNIRADRDGQFVFEYVPTNTDFQLYAVGDGSNSNVINDSTGDSDWYDIVLRFGSDGGTATAYGKVFDSSNYPVDGATVYLVYEDEEEEDVILTTVSEEGGYYTFSNLPWEIVYEVNATYGDLESDYKEGTTGSGGTNNVFLYLNGPVVATPVPAYTGYNGPWTLINTEWYYNDTDPFPATPAVSTPAPTPLPTPVPTQAPTTGGSGSGGIATATPTPTPTPVPVSSENTNIVTDNLWWLLLAILIVAVIGTWYVTRQK